MKRISLSILGLLLGMTAASAQYRPGMSSLGGTFDFGIPETGANSLTIAPSYSYAFNENFLVGTELVFLGIGEARMYGIAPFLRGNLRINESAGAFARVQQLFIYGDLGTDLSSTTFGIGADAGLYYWISQRFSVELTLADISLVNTSVDFDDTEVGDETNFLGGLDPVDVQVSVYFHF